MTKFLLTLATAASLACPFSVSARMAPPPIEAYGELPTVEKVSLSPSGRLATLTKTQGKRVILITDKNLQAVSMIEVGDIKVRGIAWAGEDYIIVTRSDTQELGKRYFADSWEVDNAMLVNANTGDVKIVFHDDRSIMNGVFGFYGTRQIDGEHYGYFRGFPLSMGQNVRYFYDGEALSLYQVNLRTNEAKRVASGISNELTNDWLVNSAGGIAVQAKTVDDTGRWTISNGDGKVLASGTEPKGSASIMSFGPRGDTVIFAVHPEHGWATYFEVPLSGGTSKKLWSGADVDEYFFAAGSRLIGYRPNDAEDDTPVFLVEEPKAAILPVVTSFDKINGEVIDWTDDYKKVLVYSAGNGDSGTYYLVDTAEKSSQVIAQARPDINPDLVAKISYFQYAAEDGTEIEAVLTLPPGRDAKNLPFIMLPHGGPRAHDEDTFDWWAQAYASRGYAVIQPNFRGSTGYGHDFMHAGDGEWGKKMQTDLDAAISYLATEGTIDPARGCIVGASYGGYAALAGVTLQNGIYNCSVSVAGVADLKHFFERKYIETNRSEDTREGWLEMMGARSDLNSVSPRKFAGQADAPVLLIHGKDDTVVPYDQTELMADALRDAGKPVEVVELSGEDHWLSRSETRNRMLQASMAFIERNNPAH